MLETHDLVKCFNFAKDVAQHTYRRLSQSRVSLDIHLLRITTGKCGELGFMKHPEISKRISDEQMEKAFEIWPGTENVDAYDLKISSKKIDVKTLFMSNHRYVINPQDQWKSMPKDYYVGTKLLVSDDTINTIKKLLLDAYQKEKNGDWILNKLKSLESINSMDVQILGYLPRDSPKWIHDAGSYICTEHPCVRVHIDALERFEELIRIL